MEAAVECTHCRVVMTSWSAPGSQIRYYQCPFCARTHSSLYGEVFRRHAGARLIDAPAPQPAPTSSLPMASPEDVRWARVRASAARWFAKLEAEEQRSLETPVRPARRPHVRVEGAPAPLPLPPKAARSAAVRPPPAVKPATAPAAKTPSTTPVPRATVRTASPKAPRAAITAAAPRPSLARSAADALRAALLRRKKPGAALAAQVDDIPELDPADVVEIDALEDVDVEVVEAGLPSGRP